jgi:PAS domain S-box-containing protein
LELARLTDESDRARRMNEAVLSTILDLVFVLDREHRLTYANGALLGLVGLPPDQALGREFADLGGSFGDLDLLDREIDRVIQDQQPIRGEVTFEKGGDRRIYDYILAPILSADGEVEAVAGSSRDVTDRKAVEDALKDADRKKDQFLATLAHELRNPLAPIRNSLNLLCATSDADDSAEALAIMDRQVGHLVRLVDDLLEISRITSGKIKLLSRIVDIGDVVRQAVEISRPLIDTAELELKISIAEDLPAINADPVRLAQVVANLLNNAARYSGSGRQIRLAVRRSAGGVAISVRDDGIGIPADMLRSIFGIFTQVTRDRDHSNGGLGIGLSLAKGLVELHGGTIEARSAGLGQGSEFIVRLPAASHVPPAESVERAVEPPKSIPRGVRILVVDDNQDSARSLGRVLKLLGGDVRIANDGASALKLIFDSPPSIAFLDLGMPEMDGYELARRIRQGPQGETMTLVALTGWGRDEDLARTKAAGFDAHYIKPIDLDSLEQLLRSLGDPEG